MDLTQRDALCGGELVVYNNSMLTHLLHDSWHREGAGPCNSQGPINERSLAKRPLIGPCCRGDLVGHMLLLSATCPKWIANTRKKLTRKSAKETGGVCNLQSALSIPIRLVAHDSIWITRSSKVFIDVLPHFVPLYLNGNACTNPKTHTAMWQLIKCSFLIKRFSKCKTWLNVLIWALLQTFSHRGQTNLLFFADNSLLFLSSLRQCLNQSVRRDHFISIFTHCS